MLLKAFKTRVIWSILTSNKYLKKKKDTNCITQHSLYILTGHTSPEDSVAVNIDITVSAYWVFFPESQLICTETSRAF